MLTQWTWQGVRSWRCHVSNECSYARQIGGVAAFCGKQLDTVRLRCAVVPCSKGDVQGAGGPRGAGDSDHITLLRVEW